MHSFYDILVQAIGFLGLLFFFISFQVKTNKRFFVMQTLGCLTFSLQFALLGAFSGALSLLVNITRNAMLTKYNESALVRWKGWIAVFSALSARCRAAHMERPDQSAARRHDGRRDHRLLDEQRPQYPHR